MIKKILLYGFLFLSVTSLIWYYLEIGRSLKVGSESKPIKHNQWTDLLAKHVIDGKVNYKGFQKDRLAFEEYLSLLSSVHPNDKHWSESEQLAFWINAYNAFTVQLILDHYPIKSIRNIKEGLPFVNSVWDIDFIKIEGHVYSLNDIEHRILRRQYQEPRIHFAIVCASISCPKLRNEAFDSKVLDAQLQDQALDFLSDPIKNKINPTEMQVSKIFLWFKKDFTKQGDLRSFLKTFKPEDVREDSPITYLEYDWNLNE